MATAWSAAKAGARRCRRAIAIGARYDDGEELGEFIRPSSATLLMPDPLSIVTALALVNTSRVIDDLNTLRSFGAAHKGAWSRGVSRGAIKKVLPGAFSVRRQGSPMKTLKRGGGSCKR